ncbi:hypothetical protein DPEC_G00024130 [Dallia pectoralis]|uniref:Uncharacterized protein n=1 Tax=Dallia pectoralis TaxID=75939 RepID=A0ACC2HHU3_DALPE|nr:hypothetical protein DPEC_G00024130 [Dallia pectoralis]
MCLWSSLTTVGGEGRTRGGRMALKGGPKSSSEMIAPWPASKEHLLIQNYSESSLIKEKIVPTSSLLPL